MSDAREGDRAVGRGDEEALEVWLDPPGIPLLPEPIPAPVWPEPLPDPVIVVPPVPPLASFSPSVMSTVEMVPSKDATSVAPSRASWALSSRSLAVASALRLAA